MTRRDGLALVAGHALSLGRAPAAKLPLDWFGAAQGVAVATDARTGQVIASHRLETARALAVPPGSVVKPLTLLALMEAGKLVPGESFPCSGQLRIGGAQFACSHPKLQVPVDIQAAIAYSCNEFVGRLASRFAPGELGAALSRFGLGPVPQVRGLMTSQLQALGERNVSATATSMAEAYRLLAERVARPANEAILQGLEQAVEYGTAQKAAAIRMKVAGKTGTAPGSWAWFAGFGPSRAPKVIVVVLVRGHAGGADAAPIAGRLFAAFERGDL